MSTINTILIIIIVSLLLIPNIWRYNIRPYLAKRKLLAELNTHPDKDKIFKTLTLLLMLYEKTNPRKISKHDRKKMGLMQDAYIYGEIDFLSFLKILVKAKPKKQAIFYDLGSGAGKAVFTAALFFDLSKAYGIEQLPGLCELANSQIKKVKSLIKQQNNDIKLYQKKLASIQFINDDILNCDFTKGDIIFINATCFSYPTWEKIKERLKLLKTGSRVITCTKRLEDDDFKVLYQGFELMSWGVASVNIYEKER